MLKQNVFSKNYVFFKSFFFASPSNKYGIYESGYDFFKLIPEIMRKYLISYPYQLNSHVGGFNTDNSVNLFYSV